ncbi:MAG: hypothetical protein OXS30_08880 [Chloroflexota bacterium]|nr:hypothetical protein [Chloroflexota bacterium]
MQSSTSSDDLLTNLVTNELLDEFANRLVKKIMLAMIVLTTIQIVAIALIVRL